MPFLYWVFGHETLIAMICRYLLQGDGQAFVSPLVDFWWRESLEFMTSGLRCWFRAAICVLEVFLYFFNCVFLLSIFLFQIYESDVKKKLTFRQALSVPQSRKPDPPLRTHTRGGVRAGGLRPPASRFAGCRRFKSSRPEQFFVFSLSEFLAIMNYQV